MGFFNKTKVNTKVSDNKINFLQALKTIKSFISEGEDVPSLYNGNEITDSQEFEEITTVDPNTFEKELDDYFDSLTQNKMIRKKKKIKKRFFSTKVTYIVNINTENGMKIAKLKIDYKYKNHQLQNLNIKVKTKAPKKINKQVIKKQPQNKQLNKETNEKERER